MGDANAKPSKHLQTKNDVPAVPEQICQQAEVQESSQNPVRLEPLADIYIKNLTIDIRSDYIYSGLMQHYQAGNAVTASFNLVPTSTSDPVYLYKHRAVIRLVPSHKYQGNGAGVEYDFQIETSMMMAKIFDKGLSGTKCNRSITIERTFSTRATTSGTGATTSGTGATTSGSRGTASGPRTTTSGAEDITSGTEESMSLVEDTAFGVEGTGTKGATQNIDILEKIAQYSSQGGRIMCITVMGGLDQTFALRVDLFDPKLRFNTVSFVDIFLEVPRTLLPAMFIYQAVTALIPYRVKGFCNKEVSVVFDYVDFFITHLNQGWKLVGIIQCYTGKNRLKSLWFFEKEKMRINDPSPVYEGTIVVHKHICEGATKEQEAITSDVTPVLQEMGAKGWEIACSLETPDAKRLNKITTQINESLIHINAMNIIGANVTS